MVFVHPNTAGKLDLEVCPELTKKIFPLFIENHGVPVQIYYPCSGTDVSPSHAFPTSHVTYVDHNHQTAYTLRRAGLKAYHVNAIEFHPDREIDLLLLFNPGLNAQQTNSLANKIKPAHILCDNDRVTASHLIQGKRFEQTMVEGRYSFFRRLS